jgi:NAD(P)-dependent dehydrogenase (short-subunit alcohol dehydrogenase family)
MKVAWITGGGSGIGAAIAMRLVAEGWTVAATARSAKDLADLAALPEAQGRIHAYPGDVTDRVAMEGIVEAIEAELGPVQLLVAAAGAYIPFGLADFSAEKMEAIYRVNVLGVANVIAPLIPGFLARNRGQIAVVTSFSQYRGLGRTAGYGSTKAALLSMCETLRLQTRGTGIVVQVLVPGFVETRMTENSPFPLPGIISAEDAARMAVEGIKSGEFEVLIPPDMVGKVREARKMDPEDYFEMAARTPLFGGKAD